jgi:hypothetical protein
MKLLAASALALGLGLFATAPSEAMPLVPFAPAGSAEAVIIPVAGGCGWGFHRGPYGGCRPLYNCPPGFHTGPYGRHCFRNW